MTTLTREYRLTRTAIALASARGYVSNFWWALIAVPVAGIAILLWGRQPVFEMIGYLCLIWPFTIPARAFLLTASASKQLLKPTTLKLSDSLLVFEASDGTTIKIKRESIYRITPRGALYQLQTKKLNLTFIPIDSFLDESSREAFLGLPES